uniref:Uncharacterized protein n=1 Tax=candidate division WOR-3 bacterium TaxID=2052148 RepID=A0A7C4X9K2_UNCW3
MAMKWTVHPAKDNQSKTVFSLIFISIFLFFILIFYGFFWALLGAIFLFASLSSYYLPTSYLLDDDHIEIKGLFSNQNRNLKEFKKIYYGKNGVLLSPFRKKTFLNHFRGIYLLLPRDKEEIISYIKDKIGNKLEGNE